MISILAQRQIGTAPREKHAHPSLASNVMLGVCAPAIPSTGRTTPGPTSGSSKPQQLCRLQAELLDQCGHLASRQLCPTGMSAANACMEEHLCDEYEGPVALLKEAHKATCSRGSTKLLLTVLDNSTMIHGGREPMAAVLCVGDCRLMLLRRTQPKGSRSGRVGRFELIYSSNAPGEPGGVSPPAASSGFQKYVLPAFQCLDKTGTSSDDEAVERALNSGGTVRCITVRRGDILVLWSIGLGVPSPERTAEICTEALGASAPRSSTSLPIAHSQLHSLGCRLLSKACARLDASVVVAEVVEWAHSADHEEKERRIAFPEPKEDMFDDVAAPFAQTPPQPARPPVLPPVVSQCRVVTSPPSTPSTSTGSFISAGFSPHSPMPAYVRAR